MEELKRLEQVQKVLSLMQSHRIGHLNSPQSDRFVASLILLLVSFSYSLSQCILQLGFNHHHFTVTKMVFYE